MSAPEVSAERQRCIDVIIRTPRADQVGLAIKAGAPPGESDAVAERQRCLRLVVLAGSAVKNREVQYVLVKAVQYGRTAEELAAAGKQPWTSALAALALGGA